MAPAPTLEELRARLPELLLRDERRLRTRLDRRAASVDVLAREVAEAERRVARRRAAVPVIRYPEALPVSERKDEILATIRDHQVVVLAGETGSGKSTQLPKICLELGRGVRGTIGHTQPRRLAARAVAERVAEELGTDLGDVVGYTVRFTDRAGDRTLVKVMTDGILLAELQRDRHLSRYDTLIVDEAHERSLNIDFILGYLHQLLPRRPDLKVIVTSATIDTERFSRHFGDAPVVEVTGRTYPVEVRYRALDPDEEPEGGVPGVGGREGGLPGVGGRDAGEPRDQTQAVCDALLELEREGPGDVLVFLSGEREIRDTAEAVTALGLRNTEVLPLYARLSAAEQHRIFAPHAGRRVVLATNVAETSLTVPGVRYVVDAGTARVSRYSRRTKVQRLPIEPVSQAAANQRAGRCGRVAPGVCIRLYAEADFASRPEFTEPEILRTNLASVILQMAALGLGDVAAFPFVDPPDARSIKDGMSLLDELGALDLTQDDPRRRLTPMGRQLAQIPLDPRLARMVLEAAAQGSVREVMVIAAALSIQDPRERPTGKQQAADESHRRFADPASDFLSYVRLWDHLRERQRELSSNQFRKLCRTEFLNHLRVREWQDIYSQVRQIAGNLGVHPQHDAAEPDAVHLALLSGLLSHVGLRDEVKREYLGAHNARFSISPGSALFRKPPTWMMAAELVETTRLWARVAARIQPEWVEKVGPHLVRRTYSEPRWNPKRASVQATERVTLYGLPVVPARTVDYGRIDPAVSRELFLQHALVDGEWDSHHRFIEHNRARIAEVRALEDRVRRRDILVDEEALLAFYDERVGADVVSGRHFDAWWKERRATDPHLLDLSIDDLVHTSAGEIDLDGFPDRWRQGDLDLRLSYRFAPGEEADGVTVHVPLALLNRVDADAFTWHVPGFRADLVGAAVRSLPKTLRRNLVPVAEHVATFLATASPEDGPLPEVLARGLSTAAGEPIRPRDLRLDTLPDHLRMSFRVEDERGRRVAFGTDLDALRDRLAGAGHLQAALSRAVGSELERTGLTSWTIGTLPRVVEGERDGHRVRAYPALVDEGPASVGVRLLASGAEQERAMWDGTRRLLLLGLPSPLAALDRLLRRPVKLALMAAPEPTLADVLEECVAAALDDLLVEAGGPAWTEAGFDALSQAVRADLVDRAMAVAGSVARILDRRTAISARLDGITAPPLLAARLDVRRQLARMVHHGFVTGIGARRLGDVERYLDAVDRRLDRLPSDPVRDAERMARVHPLEERFERLLTAAGRIADRGADVAAARWMLQELRVSLFAQTVGTPYRISEERVRRALDALEAE